MANPTNGIWKQLTLVFLGALLAGITVWVTFADVRAEMQTREDVLEVVENHPAIVRLEERTKSMERTIDRIAERLQVDE